MKRALIILAVLAVSLSCESDRSRKIRELKEEMSEITIGSKEEQKENLQIFKIVESRVKSDLKAPSTAVFPNKDEVLRLMDLARGVAQDAKTDTLDIMFAVDSQNSYGAMLRKNVLCKVVPKNNSYEVIKVIMW